MAAVLSGKQTKEQAFSIESQPSRWPASLQLSFCKQAGKTLLHRKRHHGPLYVQKAFYPEGQDCAHVYLLHPPGGIVSGDSLEISISLDKEAKVLLTTPGATRLYRARLDENEKSSESEKKPLVQRVVNQMSVNERGYLEWLPGETIVYDGANLEMVTDVSLGANSLFCGWEISCLGLPASNAYFREGSFNQSFSISIDGVPKVIDRLAFDADSIYLKSLCGFQGCPVFGTMIVGPFSQRSCDASSVNILLDTLRDQIEKQGVADQAAVTWVNEFMIMRYLGRCSDQARQLFIAAWKILRPQLVERKAIAPRIWAT